MDLSIETTTVTGLEDRSWLGSAHGSDSTQSCTLDAALFTAGIHYPNGEIRSGTVLGRVTATGLYGPYDNAVVDGREVAAGLLFNTVRVRAADARIGAPILEHGRVRVANLPANHGLDAAARADLPNIRFAD
jgi:hypothetical protein